MAPQYPVASRWARFGQTDRRWFTHVPQGGFCVSAFLIVRNPKGEILLGRPREHRDWQERGCVPVWRLREFVKEGSWILPASHFLMEEAPGDAATRVARDWAGLTGSSPRLVTVTSELFPTGQKVRVPGGSRRVSHWALCFVYEVRARGLGPSPRGWEELRFFGSRELQSVNIGRGHRDLIRAWRENS